MIKNHYVIEDDWYLYFLGVHIGLSTRCKICFTLKSLSLSLKSHMECALKLTDLWITRLLFDLNYKFISRSFAFSPRTESIYYYSGFSLTFSFRNLRLKVCRGQKRDFKMKKKGIRRGYLSLASLQDKHLTFAEGELKARGEAKPRKAGFFLISDSL